MFVMPKSSKSRLALISKCNGVLISSRTRKIGLPPRPSTAVGKLHCANASNVTSNISARNELPTQIGLRRELRRDIGWFISLLGTTPSCHFGRSDKAAKIQHNTNQRRQSMSMCYVERTIFIQDLPVAGSRPWGARALVAENETHDELIALHLDETFFPIITQGYNDNTNAPNQVLW